MFYLADHGHEVSTARGRLEGALQILIEKTESEDSDESDVDVTDLIHEGRRYSLTIVFSIPNQKSFLPYLANQHLLGSQEQLKPH